MRMHDLVARGDRPGWAKKGLCAVQKLRQVWHACMHAWIGKLGTAADGWMNRIQTYMTMYVVH